MNEKIKPFIIFIYLFIAIGIMSSNAQLTKLENLIDDDGINGDLHKNHVGEIVFSKQFIPKKDGKESQLSNKFNLETDNICFRAFYNHSFYNQCLKDGEIGVAKNLSKPPPSKLLIKFEVNGESETYSLMLGSTKYKELFQKSTSMSFEEPLHDYAAEELDSDLSLLFYNDVVPLMEVGENKVKMTLTFFVFAGKYKPKTPVAMGEFIVIAPEEDENSDDAEANSDGTFSDEGITCDLHKNNIRKIVFSKDVIPKTEGKDNQLSNKFILGQDDINFRAFFEQSFHNECIKDGQSQVARQLPRHQTSSSIFIEFEVNGNKGGTKNYYRTLGHGDKYRFMFQEMTNYSIDEPLHKADGTSGEHLLSKKFSEYIIPGLKYGDNKIKMTITFRLPANDEGSAGYTPKTPVAIGEFIITKQIQDDGISSELHKNHVGEIVFSKQFIDRKNATESQLTNKFILGTDDIYIRAFYEQSYHHHCLKNGQNWIYAALPDVPKDSKEYIYFEVNGKIVSKNKMNSHVEWLESEEFRHTFQRMTNFAYKTPINKADYILTTVDRNIIKTFLTYVVPNLKQGDNKIKMVVTYSVKNPKTNKKFIPENPVASGEFILNVKTTAMLKEYILNNGFGLKSAQNNPTLENGIRSAYKGSKKLKQIVLRESSWTINKNYKKEIVSRQTDISLVYANPNGTYESSMIIVAIQKYMGGGKYGKTLLKGDFETNFELPAILFK